LATNHILTVVCDDFRQEANGKFVLIGVYPGQSLGVPSVPFLIPVLSFYQQWSTDFGGPRQLTASLYPSAGGPLIMQLAGVLNPPNPGIFAGVLQFRNVMIPQFGRYRLITMIGPENAPVVVEFAVALPA
jgi:hypothetical protein